MQVNITIKLSASADITLNNGLNQKFIVSALFLLALSEKNKSHDLVFL